MNLFEIVLLAVALAMDCLTVSIVGGVTGSRRVWRMALLFGLFQALMPLLGWLGISWFSSYLEAVDHWIAFALLTFVGGKMIKDSFEPEEEHSGFDLSQLRTQLLLAVATSIDALAVGISLACTGYERISQLWLPLVIIGGVSLLFSLVGHRVGMTFGTALNKRLRPELLGGIILILIGLKILLF